MPLRSGIGCMDTPTLYTIVYTHVLYREVQQINRVSVKAEN